MNIELKLLLWLLCFGLLQADLAAQDNKKAAPTINYAVDRGILDYSYLRDTSTAKEYEKVFAQDLKFIPLSKNKEFYFTLGGQYRPRYEMTINDNWTDEDFYYYSHRLFLSSNFHFGKYVRAHLELHNALTTNSSEVSLEDDDLFIYQGYAEFTVPVQENKFLFTIGRKLLNYGAERLISRRAGPNVRRSFDLIKADYVFGKNKIEAFYGFEVSSEFGIFDNDFTLFDGEDDNGNLGLIGVYATLDTEKIFGSSQIYYLRYHNQLASFSDVVGEETRHTIGFRRYGSIGKRGTFNTELIYQFGKIGGSDISAFNIEVDYSYAFPNSWLTPKLGIKYDYSSGDRNLEDGKINTFQPLFVNPAIYSLASINTPANLNGIHPNILLTFSEKFSLYLDYSAYWRASKNDGYYTPPRFESRGAELGSSAFLGHAIGMKINYYVNRNIYFWWRSGYFIAGDFIKESGTSNNIFYTGPNIEFNF